MSEQERRHKRREKQRNTKAEETPIRPIGNRHEDVERKLKEVDAAFDDYLATAGTSAVGPSVNVGQQQSHQVVRPLSNEALVQGFRQTSGE